MKITQLIKELEKLNNQFGDIDIIYSHTNDDAESYCELEKIDLFVVSDKKLDKTNALVLNPYLLWCNNYKGYNNIVKHNRVIDK